MQDEVNNGGSTDYYNLPAGCKSVQDIIEKMDMHWNMANIFKSVFRLGRQDHSDSIRVLNKIIWFAKRQLKIEKAYRDRVALGIEPKI